MLFGNSPLTASPSVPPQGGGLKDMKGRGIFNQPNSMR